MADVKQRLLDICCFTFRLLAIFMLALLRFYDLAVAITVVLVKDLTRLVPVTSTVLVNKLHEKAIFGVRVITATASILFFRHRCHKILGLLKCLPHWLRVNQRLQELLVEFERACLSNLIGRVNRNNCRGGFDALNKDLAKALRVASAQDNHVNVKLFVL